MSVWHERAESVTCTFSATEAPCVHSLCKHSGASFQCGLFVVVSARIEPRSAFITELHPQLAFLFF